MARPLRSLSGRFYWSRLGQNAEFLAQLCTAQATLGKIAFMTSEIALLNRSAVALAADSAMTITYWDQGQQETRYFKGANKIFQLSEIHPVGVMIYATADFQGVPWDVLIKSDRQH